MLKSKVTIFTLFATALPLSAQELPSAALAIGQRIPIHTQADDPVGGSYGTWGAGPGFKVAFNLDGIALYPYASEDPKGGAWQWTTESVTVGGLSLLSSQPVADRWIRPDRVDYRFGSVVTERYELLDEGVEQTFTIQEKPEITGGLVVRGLVTSPWQANPVEAAQQSLVFGDGDRELIGYGRALAIDARGRRIPVDTAWDGEYITLTVPSSFVESATYPLVIDPMIGPRQMYSSGLDQIRSVDVARDDDANKIWVAVTWSASGRDDDLVILRCDDDFRNGVVVFSDITASWSSELPKVVTVGGARKSVTAFHRVFSSSQHSVRWHVHGLADATLQNSYGVMPGAVGSHDWRATAGGSRAFATGSHALIAFQRDVSGSSFQNTANSQVVYALVDVGNAGQGVVSTVRRLRTRSYDQESPSATPLAEGGINSTWPLVWQEYGAFRRGGRAWDALVGRVSPANGGSVSSSMIFARTSQASSAHCLKPTIAGQSGRYMLTYAESSLQRVSGKTPFPQGHALVAERLDWSNSGSPRFVHPPVVLHSAKDRRFQNGGSAYDSDTRSHWAATYVDTIANRAAVDKLGYRGRVIVGYYVFTAGTSDPVVGSVSFDDDNDRFAFGASKQNPLSRGWNAYGGLLTYGTARAPSLIGSSCSSATPRWLATNRRGDEFSGAAVSNAPVNRPAVVLLSLRPATVGLTSIGMRNCFLFLDLTTSPNLAVSTSVNSVGSAAVSLPLPEDYGSVNLFTQWFFLDPQANVLGVTSTSGLHVVVVD